MLFATREMVSAGQRTQLFGPFGSNAIGRIGGNLWGLLAPRPGYKKRGNSPSQSNVAKGQQSDDHPDSTRVRPRVRAIRAIHQ